MRRLLEALVPEEHGTEGTGEQSCLRVSQPSFEFSVHPEEKGLVLCLGTRREGGVSHVPKLLSESLMDTGTCPVVHQLEGTRASQNS